MSPERPASTVVRPLPEADLAEADRICRVAFGTFLASPDPERFFGDVEVVRTRWGARPEAALAAYCSGRLAGSNFATGWGSVGFLGPLTVAPECWNRGIAGRLLDATLEIFKAWGTTHIGLFTFAHSPKHVGLYQRFGFWPRSLTAVMSRPLVTAAPETAPRARPGTGVAAPLSAGMRAEIRGLTDAVHPGLDVTAEIDAVIRQRLGDVVMLRGDRGDLEGVAVCHIGAGTEAGGGTCYIKFGAARPGPGVESRFARLVDACNRVAADWGASVVTAGVNAGRESAWRALQTMGFRTSFLGVVMDRPNEAGYNTARSYVIDDWR